MKRFVDIGTDLFAMSCACSYADSLLRKGEGRNDALKLAELFCRQARTRVIRRFRDVRHNEDNLSNSISKGMLAGSCAWLEQCEHGGRKAHTI